MLWKTWLYHDHFSECIGSFDWKALYFETIRSFRWKKIDNRSEDRVSLAIDRILTVNDRNIIVNYSINFTLMSRLSVIFDEFGVTWNHKPVECHGFIRFMIEPRSLYFINSDEHILLRSSRTHWDSREKLAK